MFGLRAEDTRIIIEVLRRYPEIKEALIFGSRAMGNYKPGSDVDIALKGSLNSETANLVYVALNEHTPLPYKFDVVAYSTISYRPFQEHIDQYGKHFYP